MSVNEIAILPNGDTSISRISSLQEALFQEAKVELQSVKTWRVMGKKIAISKGKRVSPHIQGFELLWNRFRKSLEPVPISIKKPYIEVRKIALRT